MSSITRIGSSRTASTTSATCPVTTASVAGDGLLVSVAFGTDTVALSTISDTKSNTYSLLGDIGSGLGGPRLYLYGCANPVALTTSDHISVTTNGSTNLIIVVEQVSSDMTLNLDGSPTVASTSATNENTATGAATTVNTGDNVYALLSAFGSITMTVASGWSTNGEVNGGPTMVPAYELGVAAGTVTASASWSGGGEAWAVLTAAFLPPTSAVSFVGSTASTSGATGTVAAVEAFNATGGSGSATSASATAADAFAASANSASATSASFAASQVVNFVGTSTSPSGTSALLADSANFATSGASASTSGGGLVDGSAFAGSGASGSATTAGLVDRAAFAGSAATQSMSVVQALDAATGMAVSGSSSSSAATFGAGGVPFVAVSASASTTLGAFRATVGPFRTTTASGSTSTGGLADAAAFVVAAASSTKTTGTLVVGVDLAATSGSLSAASATTLALADRLAALTASQTASSGVMFTGSSPSLLLPLAAIVAPSGTYATPSPSVDDVVVVDSLGGVTSVEDPSSVLLANSLTYVEVT